MSDAPSTQGSRRIDTAELVERLKGRPAAARAAEQFVAKAGTVLTGRLVRHGEANYEFRAEASPSYFVELQSSRGLTRLWGTDLKRALAEALSQPQVGDLIGAQRTGYQVLAARDQDGTTLRRARWRVEGVTQFAAALRADRREREAVLSEQAEARRRPELRAAYVSLALAREYAERSIRDPADRQRFLDRLQQVMAASAAARLEPRSARGRRHPTPDRDGPTR